MKSKVMLFLSVIFLFVFCRDQKVFDEGMSYFNNGHYLMASGRFDTYTKKYSNDWKGYYYLALCYLRGGATINVESCVANFITSINKASQLKPFSESDYIEIVKEIIAKNSPGENIWYSSDGKLFVENSLTKCGNSKDALYLKAEYFDRQLKHEQAIEVLKAVGNNFSDAYANYRIARYFYDLNVYDSSKKYISTAISFCKPGDTITAVATQFANMVDKAISLKSISISEIKLQVDNFFPEGGAFSRRSYHHEWDRDGFFNHNNLFLWLIHDNPLPINLTECDISFIYKKTKDTIITLHYYFTTPNFWRCDTTCGDSKKTSLGKPESGGKGGLVVAYDESNPSYQNLDKIFTYAASNKLYPYDLFNYAFKNISYEPIAGLELSWYNWNKALAAKIPKQYTKNNRLLLKGETTFGDMVLSFNIEPCNTVSEAESLYNLIQNISTNDPTLSNSINNLWIQFWNGKSGKAGKLMSEKRPGASFVKTDTDFNP